MSVFAASSRQAWSDRDRCGCVHGGWGLCRSVCMSDERYGSAGSKRLISPSRSVDDSPQGQIKNRAASVGAPVVVVSGVMIRGIVGAGSVVTPDVDDLSLDVGNAARSVEVCARAAGAFLTVGHARRAVAVSRSRDLVGCD